MKKILTNFCLLLMKKRVSFTGLLLIVLLSNNTYSQWSVDPTVNNPICTAANIQDLPTITTDGSDGAIITWKDHRFSNGIFAQRINSNGAVQWTTNGVSVAQLTWSLFQPTITSDGSGGAFITWEDVRAGNGTYTHRE